MLSLYFLLHDGVVTLNAVRGEKFLSNLLAAAAMFVTLILMAFFFSFTLCTLFFYADDIIYGLKGDMKIGDMRI